jgi:hypothetical protein
MAIRIQAGLNALHGRPLLPSFLLILSLLIATWYNEQKRIPDLLGVKIAAN